MDGLARRTGLGRVDRQRGNGPVSDNMQMLRDLGKVKAELSAVKAELAGLRERIDDVVISNLRDHGKRMAILETRVAALEAAENRRAGGMAALVAVAAAAGAAFRAGLRGEYAETVIRLGTIQAEYEAGSHGQALRQVQRRQGCHQPPGEKKLRLNMLRVPLIGLLTQKSTPSSTPLTLKKGRCHCFRRRRERGEHHPAPRGVETQRALFTTAIEKNDFDKAKFAKITAEALKIRQEAERKAWGIRDVDAQPDGGADRSHPPGKRRVGDGDYASAQLAARDYQSLMWRFVERVGRRCVPALAPLYIQKNCSVVMISPKIFFILI